MCVPKKVAVLKSQSKNNRNSDKWNEEGHHTKNLASDVKFKKSSNLTEVVAQF